MELRGEVEVQWLTRAADEASRMRAQRNVWAVLALGLLAALLGALVGSAT
jgi:hypothetical protein